MHARPRFPKLLVDLRKLADLRGIRISEKGVALGAMVRWREIEDDARLDTAHPLLKAAVAHVAHYQIRNRGTVGGSMAHADPAAEMPGIAMTCDAEIAVVGKSGARVIQAADFFQGPLTTALTPDEIIVEIRLPHWPAGRRCRKRMTPTRIATLPNTAPSAGSIPFVRPPRPADARIVPASLPTPPVTTTMNESTM